ncbi:MAG: NAD(P)-binding domain-containing protein, partial [Prevotellaceae bacterium]|nr:NAD(P)-binding domain-containing protein [Prevotellaceae bacterium]
MNKIVIIGAGNVAWNLAHTLPFCGCAVTQIVSRTKHAAQTLAMGTGADFTANFAQISSDADFYIYAVRDDALNAVIEQVRVNSGIHIHTSGAVDMSVFKRKKDNYGVFYPYQTFTKNKLVDFKQTPIFIEANSEKNLEIIYNFSKNISNKIFKIN